MALNFHPYPFPQRQPEPSFDEQYVQPLTRLTGAFNDYRQRQSNDKYRDFQMQMMKAKEEREQAQHNYDYGDPNAPLPTESGFAQRDPRMNLYQPATMGEETQYGNITGAAQPESMAPRMPQPGAGGLMQRFRYWQEARRNQAQPDMTQEMTPAQMFAPSFGAKRREDYFKGRKNRLEEEDLQRKGRLTDADIGLKEAQANYYKRSPGRGAGGRQGLQGVTYANLVAQRNQLMRQKEYAIPGSQDEIDAMAQMEDIDQELLQRRGKPTSPQGADPGTGQPAPSGSFKTPEEVRAAFQSGKISRARAKSLIQSMRSRP